MRTRPNVKRILAHSNRAHQPQTPVRRPGGTIEHHPNPAVFGRAPVLKSRGIHLEDLKTSGNLRLDLSKPA